MRAGKPDGINNPNQVPSGRVRKTYSISMRLTISLIIIVVLVSLFPISWIYINKNRQAKSTLENKADETIGYLSNILATPLWTVDEDTVIAIGDTLSRDEIIVRLVIMDSSSKALYSFKKESGSTLISREDNIYFQGHFAGKVTLSLTTRFLQKSSRDLMQSFAITTIFILVSLVVVTGLFVRIFLRKPLNSLNKIIHSYAEGDYDPPVTTFPYREFQPFGQVLIKMGQTIKAQLNDLEKAEEKYRSIFENAVEGILQTTSEGRIMNANPSLACILDYESPKELMRSVTHIGQQLFADPSRWTELLRRFKDRDIVSNFEIQIYKKNGNLQWISLNARALRNAEGTLLSLEGFLTDITVRKRLEEQLRIRQRMDSLGTLAGGIAHDFNNLLTGIMGYIDMLNLHSENFTETQKKYISNAVKSSQRAADLVSQLQTLSRGTVTKKESVDVYEAVTEVFRMLEKTTDRLIKKEVEMKPGEYYVIADASELNQVFLNLGTNAVQSIEEKGTKPGDYIIVSAEDCEVNGVDVTGLPKGEYIHIKFEDNGCGMPDEVKRKAFDPLFTTKEKGGRRGQGLGLAMVFNIITNRSGGHIDIASDKGKGAVFHIYLPKGQAEEEAGTIESISGGEETVLKLEDEEQIRELAESLLNRYGYSVITATDGEEGLDIYKEQKESIDIILLDLTMPNMSGQIVFERIQSINSDVKVIICSGQSDEDIREGILSTAGGFLKKPYRVNDLARTVREVLDR